MVYPHRGELGHHPDPQGHGSPISEGRQTAPQATGRSKAGIAEVKRLILERSYAFALYWMLSESGEASHCARVNALRSRSEVSAVAISMGHFTPISGSAK